MLTKKLSGVIGDSKNDGTEIQVDDVIDMVTSVVSVLDDPIQLQQVLNDRSGQFESKLCDAVGEALCETMAQWSRRSRKIGCRQTVHAWRLLASFLADRLHIVYKFSRTNSSRSVSSSPNFCRTLRCEQFF